MCLDFYFVRITRIDPTIAQFATTNPNIVTPTPRHWHTRHLKSCRSAPRQPQSKFPGPPELQAKDLEPYVQIRSHRPDEGE